MWRKRELLRESNVWYFARIKCGNIVSGWLWIVLSVPRTWLIVWFPEVVDRPISGMSWRSCYKNIGKNFRITPYINYAFDLINYVSLLLSSKTIANSPGYCIYTSVMNTYCVFFYLSLALIPPFFPQQLSPVLPQFPFSFFPWPSARFEPTLLFSSGVPVCLPYH